jgi:hypothetical protein
MLLTREVTRCSMTASSSPSSMVGSVRSRISRSVGVRGMNQRWKNIVWRMAVVSRQLISYNCSLHTYVCSHIPFTTSLTYVGSANTSSVYSGARRGSMPSWRPRWAVLFPRKEVEGVIM